MNIEQENAKWEVRELSSGTWVVSRRDSGDSWLEALDNVFPCPNEAAARTAGRIVNAIEQENAELHVLADDWRQIALDTQLQLATATDALRKIRDTAVVSSRSYGWDVCLLTANQALETVQRLKAGAA